MHPAAYPWPEPSCINISTSFITPVDISRFLEVGEWRMAFKQHEKYTFTGHLTRYYQLRWTCPARISSHADSKPIAESDISVKNPVHWRTTYNNLLNIYHTRKKNEILAYTTFNHLTREHCTEPKFQRIATKLIIVALLQGQPSLPTEVVVSAATG